MGAFLWHFSYARYGLVAQDEGWLLHAATRVAQGEVPYRDFLTAYVPGRYYLVAAVLESFGSSLPAVRILFCVLRALVVLLTFLIGLRIGNRPMALAAAVTVAVLPGPWHKTFYTLVPLLTFAPLLRWERTRGAAWLLLAGAVAGAGLWFRQDAAVA
ncbi:MAG: hypothetical protein HKN12_07760, partial [Gemmatimonadetes bacterium]|nr:hypothetical protein [Gemmatimonadota bacterium]